MATKNATPPSERISASLKQLADSSTLLNAASDELGKTIAPLELALKKLNLGVSTWHKYTGNTYDSGAYWARYIGYSKVSGKWGIAISQVSGNEGDEPASDEEWLFNDAPRWLRVEAFDYIPDLFEQLVKDVEETTAKIQTKGEQARAFITVAAAITALGGEK